MARGICKDLIFDLSWKTVFPVNLLPVVYAIKDKTSEVFPDV
jgi:hypothetical protein